jgi:hypothetical protein
MIWMPNKGPHASKNPLLYPTSSYDMHEHWVGLDCDDAQHSAVIFDNTKTYWAFLAKWTLPRPSYVHKIS